MKVTITSLQAIISNRSTKEEDRQKAIAKIADIRLEYQRRSNVRKGLVPYKSGIFYERKGEK